MFGHLFAFLVILIGDSGTGKSSLMTRLIKNEFIFGRVSTIGIDFLPKTITIDSRVIKALFWDTGGQERFRSITPNYYLFVSSLRSHSSVNLTSQSTILLEGLMVPFLFTMSQRGHPTTISQDGFMTFNNTQTRMLS
jgi:predicted GTPase